MFVFVDIETTGLDESVDDLLEIGIAIVDASLVTVSARSWLVKPEYPEFYKQHLFPAVAEMHSKNGLFDAIDNGDGQPPGDVERGALKFLEGHGFKNRPPMAGSSVHFDRKFIAKKLPGLASFFSYRNIDVSSITELCKVWIPEAHSSFERAETDHRVLTDIENSVQLLRYYKALFFDPRLVDG